MARFGFCGPTYQSQSPNVDAERCVNLYIETVESPGGKSAAVLYPMPGLAATYNLGATAILGQYMCQPGGAAGDRLFAVVQNGANQVLYELFADGTSIARGNLVAPTTSNITFADNGTQLIICTGGQLWLFNLATNVLTGLVGPGGSPSISEIIYSGGFFVAVQSESNAMYVSALLDGTTWPALGKALISDFPDNIVSVIVNQSILYIFGRKASVPYQNVGALNFPFLPIQGAFVEIGCGALSSPVRLDNSVFWLDIDERGGAIARKVSGYTPQRVSNHSVEHIWQKYPTVADAISYAFQDQGHSHWRIYFPSGISVDGIAKSADGTIPGAMWDYDVETGMWTEPAFWNEVAGHYEAHHSRNHAYAFGKHFVGDWKSGTIYQMAIPSRNGTAWQFADDAGSPIRRLRRGPTVSKENEYIDIPQIEFDLEVGLGPQPALVGTAPPTNFVLADPTGVLWSFGITDAGQLQRNPVVVGGAQNIAVNDPTAVVSWRLGASIAGEITATEITFSPQYPPSLLMVSATGTVRWGLEVTLVGQLVLAPMGPVTRGPQLMFRWSKDHAHTWTDYEQLDCGQAGEFRTRVIRRRIGRLRAFTPEITWTDPVPLRIVDAYIPPASERLVKQMAKMA